LSSFGPSLVEDVDVDNAVAKIRRDGFFCGLNLRREALEEFLTMSMEASSFGDENVNFPFRYVAEGISKRPTAQAFRLGKYTNALDRVPVLRALTSDPQLLAITRGYLVTEPALNGRASVVEFCRPSR